MLSLMKVALVLRSESPSIALPPCVLSTCLTGDADTFMGEEGTDEDPTACARPALTEGDDSFCTCGLDRALDRAPCELPCGLAWLAGELETALAWCDSCELPETDSPPLAARCCHVNPPSCVAMNASELAGTVRKCRMQL